MISENGVKKEKFIYVNGIKINFIEAKKNLYVCRGICSVYDFLVRDFIYSLNDLFILKWSSKFEGCF